MASLLFIKTNYPSLTFQREKIAIGFQKIDSKMIRQFPIAESLILFGRRHGMTDHKPDLRTKLFLQIFVRMQFGPTLFPLFLSYQCLLKGTLSSCVV